MSGYLGSDCLMYSSMMLCVQAEAEEELAEAKEALEKYRQKMLAAGTERNANNQQPEAVGKKLLRKRSAEKKASRDASEQAEDTDDSHAQLQRDRSAKRRKSQVPSILVLAVHPSLYYFTNLAHDAVITGSYNGRVCV